MIIRYFGSNICSGILRLILFVIIIYTISKIDMKLSVIVSYKIITFFHAVPIERMMGQFNILDTVK